MEIRGHWYLKAYKTTEESPVFVCKLQGIDVNELRRIFGESPDNPMYDCYPVTQAQLRGLEGLVNRAINLGAYDYYVEYEADQ